MGEEGEKEGRTMENFTQVTSFNFRKNLKKYLLLSLLQRKQQYKEVNNLPRITARKLWRPQLNRVLFHTLSQSLL